MISPKGKHSLTPDDMEDFWTAYGNDYLSTKLGLAEMTSHELPVLVDFDLKLEITDLKEWNLNLEDYKVGGNEEVYLEVTRDLPVQELYSLDFVDKLTEIYQQVLQEILSEVPEENLACIYLSKPPCIFFRNGKVFMKHGFHLHFPMIFLHRYIQENELLPRIRLELKKLNHGLPQGLRPEDALDKAYCRGKGQAWLLYGSRKHVDMYSYEIHSIHTPSRKRVKDWRSFLVSELHLANKDDDRWDGYRGYRLKREKESDNFDKSDPSLTMENLDQLLPRVLSTRIQGRDSSSYRMDLREDLTPIKEILQSNVAKTFSSSKQYLQSGGGWLDDEGEDDDNTDDNENENENGKKVVKKDMNGVKKQKTVTKITTNTVTTVIREMLSLLKTERAVDRNEWIYVGWVVFNILHGSTTGLDLWLEFSKRGGDKFNEASCRYEWAKMVNKNLTMGTLKHIARLDNPEGYAEITSRYAKTCMENSSQLNGTHHDLALALFQKHENEFVCASHKDKLWYRFVSPTWVRDEEGISLRRMIAMELVPEYEKTAKALFAKQIEADAEEAKMYSKKVEFVTKQISRLKNSPFKSNIMKECQEVFYDGSFYDQLDNDPFTIAFSNGVYDLKNFVFRDGRPSDRLSLKMPIAFRTDLTMDHPDVKIVLDFMKKIFPDASVREYFMNISSDVFVGGNSQKIVQVWSGKGNNGKSVTQELFEKMLGPYSIKLPTSLLVGKRTQSSSACPELARAGHGVRMAMLQEPDKSDIINVGILKELSGNDSFFARGLYKEGSEIKPMFKLVLVCNEPPKVPNNDKAAWNRIRVIPFESRFDNEAPETEEEQMMKKHFPKDGYFTTNTLPRMIEPFAWLLLEHLKKRPMVFPEPAKVLMATSDYQMKNDVFGQFIEENVVVGEQCSDSSHNGNNDEKMVVRLQELYVRFKDWHREAIPQGSVPSRSEVREYLVRVWGEPIVSGGVRWKGYGLQSLSVIVGSGEGDSGGGSGFFE
jgi:P4 family phage/plasmid primase-like protien